MTWLFALLYLLSDSTTVPLADAKLSGQRDAFEKKVVKQHLVLAY